MTSEASRDGLEDELRTIEEDLADLRRNAAELRQQVGEEEDPVDRSAVITAAEEAEALIESLQARREQLLQRLGRAAT